ncbi:hypothetical protein GCK72_012666 [Caenorhabditis remanei]|uniref:Bestrophin homolog n=1 Tax=Caenorhabditis remanei TaxID=31234 RepID=A0A6A5GNN3_CAERE|nr:hypothetical protein GCK72_012666 [Caenorhabditis remanei]KAF1756213.1 hypothetical protein GCK72_012666 [Caenorhabditis remanei]
MNYIIMTPQHKERLKTQIPFFEYAAIHLNVRLVHIPLTFMLGFFVTIVVDRWRSVFTNIGFIENVALSVGTLVAGTDHAAKVLRRTIIRYLVLSQVLVLRDIFMRVRRRFPSMESLVTEGFLYRDELENMYKCETMYNKYWLPTHWANQLVHKAMFETKNVDSVQSMNSVLMVVFLAVRVYFLICLISRQYLLSAPPIEAQSIVPIMAILQFVFFAGWMKVAEALLNPLGEDDDDFECNWLIDRNMSTGIEIVDTCHDSCPPLKLEEPDDEKGTMYWCHPTKNGSQAPPTAVAISQHNNPFAKVLNMVHSTTPESSPPSYRLDVPKQ